MPIRRAGKLRMYADPGAVFLPAEIFVPLADSPTFAADTR
jgi:hypothetical protein